MGRSAGRTRTQHPRAKDDLPLDPSKDELWRTGDVARFFDVHVRTVLSLIRRGNLPARLFPGLQGYRVHTSDLRAFVEGKPVVPVRLVR